MDTRKLLADGSPVADGPGSQSIARDAWIALLDRLGPWEWFVTLTFADELAPLNAVARFDRWCRLLSRAIYGPRWKLGARVYRCGLSWVVAAEYQRRGVIHFHALMRGPSLPDVNRFQWERVWRKVAAGRPAELEQDAVGFLHSSAGRRRGPGRNWASIEEPRSGAVAHYCSKYVTKGGCLDLGGVMPPQAHAESGSHHAEAREARLRRGSGHFDPEPAPTGTASQSRT